MKTTMSIALLALMSLFAVACGSDTDATVTGASDDTDEAVEEAANEPVAETANRIVSLSPTATEMLFAIGAGDQVIAVDAFSYYPEEAPVTDLSGFEPNVEAIAGFEPTLVVSSAPIEGLDAIDIENVVQFAAVTFDDVYSQIEQLGALTGNVGEAAELVLEMQTDIEAVVASLPERETPLTYYHELDNTLYSVTSSTFVGEVYSLLGLVNAADAADPDDEFFGYPQLNEEFLIAADPDIIFLADTLCCAQNAETVADRPGWDQLSAVQAGNIVELDDDIVSRWGPRLVDFIETAGAAIVSVEAVPAS
jgi:iron complex transport system substrate-binding protein